MLPPQVRGGARTGCGVGAARSVVAAAGLLLPGQVQLWGGGGICLFQQMSKPGQSGDTEQDEGCPTGSHVKYGSNTHSGPKIGLGVLEGSGDIVYKSVQVPIAKRAVTGCSHFSRTRGTATGCAGPGLHLVSWCCQCAVLSWLEAPNSHSAWCWSGWTWARP